MPANIDSPRTSGQRRNVLGETFAERYAYAFIIGQLRCEKQVRDKAIIEEE
jgi:hypothetical protein